MKTLLVYPPLVYNPTPFLSVPLLVGQLKAEGIDAEGLDLNLEFLIHAFSKDYIKQSILKSEQMLNELKEKYPEISSDSKEFGDLKIEDKITVLKKEKIEYFFKNHPKKLENVYKYIENAISVMRSKKYFYEPESFYKAFKIINDAFDVILLPYSPSQISKCHYLNPLFKNTYGDIKYQTEDKKTNVFIEYFENLIAEGFFDKYDVIGISIPTLSQMVAGFTLARMLKAKGKKVCLGGNILTRIEDSIIENKDIFNTFCDYISIGDGEHSLTSLIKHIEGKISIEEVTGVMYLKNNKVCTHKPDIVNIKDVKPIDFTGYDLKKYFIPEIVLSIQISKGCYWGKCAFCDFFYGKPHYSCLSASKAADFIEHLSKKYKIKYFQFEDEALSPKFCEEFANEILKRKLKIKYTSYLRLEKAFDKNLFELIHKSGYLRAFWGYEFASKRIMKLINKGIDLGERTRILKDSDEAGIWNHISLMYGFPTETLPEAEETLDFCENNINIIHSYELARFSLTKHANALKMKKELNLKSVVENENFAPDLDFTSSGMSEKEMQKLYENYCDYFNSVNKNAIASQLYFPSYLMLYISKYKKKALLLTKIKK